MESLTLNNAARELFELLKPNNAVQKAYGKLMESSTPINAVHELFELLKPNNAVREAYGRLDTDQCCTRAC